MFKMKMMALLQNKAIRNSTIVLLAVAIILEIIAWPKSDADTPVSVDLRSASMKVSAGSKDILMPEVAPGQSEKEAKYNNLYCIDEGTHLSYATYNKEINLYNSNECSKYFSNYGSALWLVDHMYISTAKNADVSLEYLAELVTSTDVKKEVSAYGNITADNIKSLNKTVGSGKDQKGNKIDRNLIEVIEQLNLWNYTKNKEKIDCDKFINAGISGTNITSDDQNACKYLYHALKYLADKNSEYTSNGTFSNAISLDNSNAKLDITKKQVGPYYLKSSGVTLNIDSNLKSKITAKVTTVDGNTKEVSSEKIKVDTKTGAFYIDITDYANVTSAEIKVAEMFSGAKVTAIALVNGKNQNVININKEITKKGFSDKKETTYSGKYTIKLVKTKADGSTAITNNPAVFTISGAENKKSENTNSDGELIITSDKPITSVSAEDKYTIVEDTAPEGFEKYNGTLNLSVKFKSSGNNYILDKENVKLTGNGTNGTCKISFKDNNTIMIYVPNKEVEKGKFDLSLRKFISKVDDKAPSVSRAPVIDAESKTILDEFGTAAYHHTKQSLLVNNGSKIEYTIRVYNEGKIDGYAKEITDYLPDGLKFVKIADESSKEYTTDATSGSKKIVLKYNGNTVIKADSITRILNGEKENIYQEVKIICEVSENATGYITNRAEITNYGYNDNGTWKSAKAIGDSDRDSVQNTISGSLNLEKWYEESKTYTYTDKSGKTSEVKDYYPGVQDDDDFETVEVKEITGQYNVVIKKVDSSNKNQGLAGAYFTIGKDFNLKVGPTNEQGEVEVLKDQKITSENEKKVMSITETTAPDGYKGYDKDIILNIVTKKENNKYILDKTNTKLDGSDSSVTIDVSDSLITITIPNEKKDFDLALRKFITKVNDKDITSRIPKVDVSELKTGTVTTAKYDHPKDPVEVCTNDIVTYTIRVYNEGEADGYAMKIMDDIPDGLEFLPQDSTNTQYKWVMYAESNNTKSENSITYGGKTYVVTTDASKADLIVTNYLENSIIKGFNTKTMTELDYKDVKVSFKVIEPGTSDRILVNYAQITQDADSNKNKVTDRDSIPNEWNEGEDDQDIEKVKVKYFDLALRKWVTQAIVIEDGETKVYETGHKAEDNPEDVVKVDLKKSKLNEVTVKFRYSIRVTNEGEIAGYAKEVSDYIPEGLKFVAADNKNWTEKDGKVVTRELENTLLQPGESAEVSILLTWVNSKNNMGVMTNTAEISEDYNDHGAKDIDSTPNNKVPGEDDIDDAPVMLTVKTGSDIITYVSIGFGVLLIVTAGVYGIKKYLV